MDIVYDDALANLPQFPVKELAKDIITVKHAADGSGTVTFEFDGNGRDRQQQFPAGTRMSIPAGITKDDVRSLIDNIYARRRYGRRRV